METGGGSSVGHEDSDLERKRREAEALLQSVGITPDIPHGKLAAAAGSCAHRPPLLVLHLSLDFLLVSADGFAVRVRVRVCLNVTSNCAVQLGVHHCHVVPTLLST